MIFLAVLKSLKIKNPNKKIKSKIIPYTIKRINNSYNSSKITGNISSATSIRNVITNNNNFIDQNILKNVLPINSLNILNTEFENNRGPIASSNFENIILTIIRKIETSNLLNSSYISEGLQNRIKKAALNSTSLEELIENISTKRYTNTRIKRILFHLLIGVTNIELDIFNKYGGPQYAKILGFNRNGKELLSIINKKSTIPIILKPAKYKNSCNPLLKKMLEIESISTDIYVLAYKNKNFKKGGQEFSTPIIVKNT